MAEKSKLGELIASLMADQATKTAEVFGVNAEKIAKAVIATHNENEGRIVKMTIGGYKFTFEGDDPLNMSVNVNFCGSFSSKKMMEADHSYAMLDDNQLKLELDAPTPTETEPEV